MNPTYTSFDQLPGEDQARVTEKLNWIRTIRVQAGDRDTVVSEREIAFLRIDYGDELIDGLLTGKENVA